jgi:S-adenosylhomocysteine hydrolase
MFYQESEHLADKHPALRETIGKIDEIIRSTGPSDVLRVEDIASQLFERQSRVSGIFKLLSEEGLLREEEYIECPECANLIDIEDYEKAIDDEDSFECTQCQCDLIWQRPERVKVYRSNPTRIHATTRNVELKTHTINSEIPEEFHEKLPEQLMEEPFVNADLLQYYSREPTLLGQMPFEGKRVFFTLHFLKDLIPFVKACENLGLNLKNAYFFYKSYPYPQRTAIKKWLEGQGATVEPRSLINQYLKQFAESSDRIGEILIIEDGGFFVPAIHREFTQLIPHVIGAVEQTTRGIFNDEDWENEKKNNKLKFPVLSVANSELKGEFEPQYIAEAVVDNIKRMLPDIGVRGQSAALLGCGTIGKKLAEWLRNSGVEVTVYDIKPENRLWARDNGFNRADSGAQASKNKNFVIGASGRESINSQAIANLTHGTHLVSASSELYEIDMGELSRRARKEEVLLNGDGRVIGTTFILPPNNREIHVLANGYPINFWGLESMPTRASQLILSLIFLSAAEIASGSYTTNGIDSDAVNELAGKYKVAEKFLENS